MDPQVAWDELLNLYSEQQHEEANQAAEDLLQWLQRGGFPPRTTHRIAAGDPLHRVIALAVVRQVLGLNQ